MFQRTIFLSCLLFAFVCHAAPVQAAGGPSKGFKFPPVKVPSIQYVAGQAAAKPKLFEFKNHTGKIPLALFYFLPQHGPSVTELKAFAMAAQIFAGKVKFLAVTKASNQKEIDATYAKLKELRIKIPVLLDAKGMMAYVMLTRRVPSYALITKKGMMRLARASKLTEKVTATDTLLGMITRVAAGEEIPFTRAPGFSPNPFNMIGKRAPLFSLPKGLKADGSMNAKPKASDVVSLKKTLKKGRPTLLVFWSVTCPHCKQVLPILDKYVQAKKGDFNAISVVLAHNKKLQTALVGLQKENGFKLPILNDFKGKTFSAYRIMMVPTLYFVRPDGIIQDVNMGGGKAIGKSVDAMMAKYKAHRTKKANPAPRPAVARPAVARPAVARPAVARPAVARPAVARPAPRKPTARRPVVRPASRRAAAKPAPRKPAARPAARPAPRKPTTKAAARKPASRPAAKSPTPRR